MNSTIATVPLSPSEYINIALGAMLLFSEILPLFKKTKGNGILHLLICVLTGSKCFIDKTINALKAKETELPKTQEISP
jgi:hypothetical protein